MIVSDVYRTRNRGQNFFSFLLDVLKWHCKDIIPFLSKHMWELPINIIITWQQNLALRCLNAVVMSSAVWCFPLVTKWQRYSRAVSGCKVPGNRVRSGQSFGEIIVLYIYQLLIFLLRIFYFQVGDGESNTHIATWSGKTYFKSENSLATDPIFSLLSLWALIHVGLSTSVSLSQ